MKKISIIFAMLLMLLTGCSNTRVVEIDEYTWLMTTVQSKEAEGQAIAYGANGSSTLDAAVEIRLECKAKNGVLTLTDKTNNKTYTGFYKTKNADAQASNYEISVGSTDGMAVLAMTTYHDGSQTPTLIIDLEDYALNFMPE